MGNRAKNQRNTHKRTIRTQQRFGKNEWKRGLGVNCQQMTSLCRIASWAYSQRPKLNITHNQIFRAGRKRNITSPICHGLLYGLWSVCWTSQGKILSLSTSVSAQRMYQATHICKRLSVLFRLITHLSVQCHSSSLMYLSEFIVLC